MDKKNKKVKVITLEEALKLTKGFYPLADLDYSKYPEIKKFVDDYNKAHPHLAIEVSNYSYKYIAKLKNAQSELVRELLECTNLFKEFYEVASMNHGIITFYTVICQMQAVKLQELQEKLNRYENND